MHNDVLKVLVSEEEIAKKVQELGTQISRDYAGKTPIVVSVLKGSVVFVSDLIRAMEVDLQIDFMVVSSFAGGTVSTGAVRIMKDIDNTIENRDVLIVEDILDSGITLEYITKIFKGRNPRSIRIATLLDKPARRKSNIVPDYVGFVIPDEFVVGYGLDYAEKYRNLPYIGVLKPCVYSKEDAEALASQKQDH